MNIYVRLALCLAIHAVGCVAYVFLNDANPEHGAVA
ncbi:hypothetical protein PS732_00607 [Pseudomonas fluorescens]|uniref:Lipoprotein n=1 Tax=Pseudomonas fluorescens TaxID=294 RepID=A0ABD7VAI6_PSEFL|nr:hypothetical protein PS732_00607 [Pseudomonas fluorescens]